MRIIIEMDNAESHEVRVSGQGSADTMNMRSQGTLAPSPMAAQPLDAQAPADVPAFDGGAAPLTDGLGATFDADDSSESTGTDMQTSMMAAINAGMAPDPAEAVMIDAGQDDDYWDDDSLDVRAQFGRSW